MTIFVATFYYEQGFKTQTNVIESMSYLNNQQIHSNIGRLFTNQMMFQNNCNAL